MLLGEEAYNGDSTGSTNDAYYDWMTDTLSVRHDNGQNIAFLDGHAKWFYVSDIIAANYVTGGEDPATACQIKNTTK
jgi:prepilin-type processing-associated H-X9-DG protein